MTATSSRPQQDRAVGYALGLSTQEQEVEQTDLTVEGTLPAWLTGSLLRTGPAKFEVGEERYRHWFDGLAMLHRFAFSGGSISYASRFLETRAYRAARERGRITYSEFATDPCRSLFGRFFSTFSPRLTDNASVNLVRLGEEYIAMTETPMPVAFDPDTERGELINYTTHFGPASRYRVYAMAPGGTPRQIAALPTRRPAYMHSFAMTERYVVLAEFPLVVNPLRLAASGRPFIENYRWEPARGTRFLVIDRESGKLRASADGPAMFAFHHVNAFEENGCVSVDMCAYEDASIVEALYLDHLRAGRAVPGAALKRCRVPLDGGDVTVQQLASETLELPRIDYRSRNGRPYRFTYGVGARSEGDFLNRLVKIDLEGDARTWSEPGAYPGEPVFVPGPEQSAEDDGVVLSVVLDATAGRSFLLVLDAASFEEVARAYAPLHIPFGFHGSFFRG